MATLQRYSRLSLVIVVIVAASLMLGLSLAILPSAAAAPNPPAEATIWLQAPPGEIAVNSEITVSVRISDVVNLYGLEFELHYSPTHLLVVDADPVKDGIQILPTDCPAPDFPVANTADNSSGVISYAVSQLYPTPPVTGHCSVAQIRLKALQGGTTGLHFQSVTLSNPDPAVIPVTIQDLELVIATEKYVYLPTIIKQ